MPEVWAANFGVLTIHGASITRRCRSRSCWYTSEFCLPQLRKKIIYLDQFVVSNILKMLSPGVPGHKRAKTRQLWRELFDALDVLTRMQLVICPDSTEHHSESLISPFYEELKHTYRHFSTGISFKRPFSIQQQQVMVAFSAYLEGAKPEFAFDPSRVTSGDLHGWADRIFVTVDGNLPGEKARIQESRKNTVAALEDVFKQWQNGGKTFVEILQQKEAAFGRGIFNAFIHDERRRALTITGQLPPTLENFLPSPYGMLVRSLEWSAKLKGFSQQQCYETIMDFVKSGAIIETPSNVISASMWSSLAMQAVNGQKKAPDEGMAATDIDVTSTFLPYCDAMFVDNKCRSLWTEIPKAHKLPYQCFVFSSKTSDQFLQYLRDIRNDATPDHVALVQEIYGPSVLEPCKSIYGDRV